MNTAIRPGSQDEPLVGQRPCALNRFEFVVVSSLRAAQLLRGCTPRVPPGHKVTVTAQQEVSQGKIQLMRTVPAPEVAAVEDELPLDLALP